MFSMYNRFRQQYSAQAQEYQRRGMSAAAMYYSSEVFILFYREATEPCY